MNNNMEQLIPKRCNKCRQFVYALGMCRHHYDEAVRRNKTNLRPRARANPNDLDHLAGGANWEPVLTEKKMAAALAEKALLESFKNELEKKLRAMRFK